MHEVFKIKSSKTNPKFQQYFINFEKPQNFSKTPNPTFQNMKCMEMKEIKSLPSEESQGKRFGVNEKGLGDEKLEVSRERERSTKNGLWIARGEYIDHQ